MIIADKTRQGRKRAAGILLSVLGLALAFVLGFVLRPTQFAYRSLPGGAIYCGADNTRGGKLVNQGQEFGNSGLRNNTHARNGRYSCFLPASGQTEYGFFFQLDNPAPGAAFRASVWRLKNAYNAGVLAVKTEGEAEAYHQENIASETDEKR